MLTNETTHKAWRHGHNGKPLYVLWIGNGQQKGDRYDYTTDESQAKPMTERQCRAFCNYMKECASVGFWC